MAYTDTDTAAEYSTSSVLSIPSVAYPDVPHVWAHQDMLQHPLGTSNRLSARAHQTGKVPGHITNAHCLTAFTSIFNSSMAPQYVQVYLELASQLA